mmetsp:Transcript_7336/g.26712  ORF Transcript_7336/g.26712 Transcript_7336/m.26712 type:complete len:350 (-) Transcript_7336:3062-4111(-)
MRRHQSSRQQHWQPGRRRGDDGKSEGEHWSLPQPCRNSRSGAISFDEVCGTTHLAATVALPLRGAQKLQVPGLQSHTILVVPRATVLQLGLDGVSEGLAGLHLAGGRRGLQDLHLVHHVPEQVVPLHVGAHDAADALPSVDAHSAVHDLVMVSRPRFHLLDHVQREQRHAQGGVPAGERRLCLSGDVGIAHGFNLIYIVQIREVVEEPEDVADQRYNLGRLQAAAQRGEAHQVGLRDGRAVVAVRRQRGSGRIPPKLLDNQGRHQSVEDAGHAGLRDFHRPLRAELPALAFLHDPCAVRVQGDCQDENHLLQGRGGFRTSVMKDSLPRHQDQDKSRNDEDQRMHKKSRI